MHQTRKGKQWYFGMKAHVGVDSKSKLIHSVMATAAHVADSKILPHLLHGEEKCVWGDQGYLGQSEAIHQRAPQPGGAGPKKKTATRKGSKRKGGKDQKAARGGEGGSGRARRR